MYTELSLIPNVIQPVDDFGSLNWCFTSVEKSNLSNKAGAPQTRKLFSFSYTWIHVYHCKWLSFIVYFTVDFEGGLTSTYMVSEYYPSLCSNSVEELEKFCPLVIF